METSRNSSGENAPAPAHGPGHVMSMKILGGVFAALLVLTVVTVWVSSLNLGNWSLYVAMAVAGVKGMLVVLFFMHLLYDKKFNMIVFLGCLAFVVLFISLALTDTTAYQPTRIPGQAPEMKRVPGDFTNHSNHGAPEPKH